MNFATRDRRTGSWSPMRWPEPKRRGINYRDVVEQRVRAELEPVGLDPPVRESVGWIGLAAGAAAWIYFTIRIIRALVGA